MFKKFITIEQIDMTGFGKVYSNFDQSITGTMRGQSLMKYNAPIYNVDKVTNFSDLSADNIEERGGKQVVFIDGKMINSSAFDYIKFIPISIKLSGGDNIRKNQIGKKYQGVVSDLLKKVTEWENKSLEKFMNDKKLEQ